MSDSLHPHWQATGEEGSAGPAAALDTIQPPTHSAHIPIHAHTISRRPAAAIGIALVLGAGYLFLHQGPLEKISGQVPVPGTQPIQVHVTKDGLTPRSITVQPGASIRWVNEQDIPHIFQSDTIQAPDGTRLYTPPIFPGGDYTFTLSPQQPNGTHTYVSATDRNVSGEMIVKGTSPAPQVSPTPLPQPPPPTPQPVPPAAPATLPPPPAPTPSPLPPPPATPSPTPPSNAFPQQTTNPTGAPAQAALIPTNPYHIGSTATARFDAYGNPIQSAFGDAAPSHSGAPLTYPTSQPETGPELWIVILLSVVTLYELSATQFLLGKGKK